MRYGASSRRSPGGRRGGRPAVALAAVAAVLATLLAVFTGGDVRSVPATGPALTAGAHPAAAAGGTGPGPGKGAYGWAGTGAGRGAGSADGAVPDPHAGDRCSAVCTTQAGTRQEPHGERTAPHGQLVGTTPRAPVVAPPAPAPRGPADGLVRPYPHHRTQDRGRAPPVATGI